MNLPEENKLLKEEHINVHFLINPVWKMYFLSKFPAWKKETWTKDVWSLFKLNGYKYTVERYSNNPKSNLYNAIKCVDLFNDDDFIVGVGDSTIDNALEQLLIHVICEHYIDFSKFK